MWTPVKLASPMLLQRKLLLLTLTLAVILLILNLYDDSSWYAKWC